MSEKLYAERLVGERVVLKRLHEAAVDEAYLRWMNDPEVTRYLQARFEPRDMANLRAFVAGFDHRDRFIFGVHADDRFIGTGTLRVNPNHRFSSIGYLIGETDYWRGEISLDVCRTLLDFVFFERNVRKVVEPTTENHVASNFNFKRLGFTLTARIPDLYWGGDRYHAAIYWSMAIEEWARLRGRGVPTIPHPAVA